MEKVKRAMEPGADDPLHGQDAFRYNLLTSSRSLSGLVMLLGLVFAYSAYCDLSAPESPVRVGEGKETAQELAARIMQVPVHEVDSLLPDGRVLMKDGSIRSP